MEREFTSEEFRNRLVTAYRARAGDPSDRGRAAKELARDFRILDAMSADECQRPERISDLARLRIAALAGTDVTAVDRLIRLFVETRAAARRAARGGSWQQLKRALGIAS